MSVESDPEAAQRRAEKHYEFWSLIFTGAGVSHTELGRMDLAEYYECLEARLLYQEKQKKLMEERKQR